MNNKGFAITGILYGLMIMFILILLSFLSVLSSKKNRLETITNSISDDLEYNDCEELKPTIIIDTINITDYAIDNVGLYYFKINNDSTICSVYLPSDTKLLIKDNKLKIHKDESYIELTISNCTNKGINSITITKKCK